jgi:hypothetical protein
MGRVRLLTVISKVSRVDQMESGCERSTTTTSASERSVAAVIGVSTSSFSAVPPPSSQMLTMSLPWRRES